MTVDDCDRSLSHHRISTRNVIPTRVDNAHDERRFGNEGRQERIGSGVFRPHWQIYAGLVAGTIIPEASP